ncbi:MAG: aminomethyl-transferring glycine dehydrogenase subunit GcvPB [Methanomicrobia archaeon]|nr:aminomethyl-transferring glycine dehydrogenase subunit GcvPB [Methanomicrobia archaeon]
MLIFDYSKEGRKAYSLPHPIEDTKIKIPEKLKRKTLNLPEVSEIDIVRHFIKLSQKNYGVDSGFYPLGSCTMKYNPKINEEIGSWEKVTDIHPYQDESTVQGSLEIMYKLGKALCKIGGVDNITLQPAAGAHGEYTGIKIIKKYLKTEGFDKNEIIVPDSAHGTNPASSAMAGFRVVEIPSNEKGCVDLDALNEAVNEKTAGLMLTNPNTLGIFEENIKEISEIIHDAKGLLYYDGANLNALMGFVKPGNMGFDLVHFNLHKTFSTPHGGGGPGSGPVGVKEFLKEYLPHPIVEYDGKKYYLKHDLKNSIGKIKGFYGNFGVIVKAYAYVLTMGNSLKKVSEIAVLNANYIAQKLKDIYEFPYSELRKHEIVLSCEKIKKDTGVTALDISKRILDYGMHAPTIYFPLIVKEALMIEPTETESKEELDKFIDIMRKIHRECYENPEIVKSAPHNTEIKRLNTVKATKEPVLSYKMLRR